MNKKLCIFLLLLYILIGSTFSHAEDDGIISLFRSDNIVVAAPFESGGNLYALAGGRVYALGDNAADESLSVSLYADFDLNPFWFEFLMPVRMGGECFLLGRAGSGEDGESHVECGMVCALEFSGGAVEANVVAQLDWEAIGTNPLLSPTLSCVFAQDGRIYALLTGGDRPDTQIAVFDLEDGSCELYAMDGVASVAPYLENAMLAVKDSGELGEIDLGDMRYAALGAFPADAAGLHYDVESNALYFVSDGALCVINDMRLNDIEILSRLPLGESVRALPVVADDAYILSDSRQVWRAPLSAVEQEQRQLVVVVDDFSGPSSNVFFEFQAKYPDVLVKRVEPGGSIIENMLNQSPEIDVYLSELLDIEYQPLFERGYMASLEKSEFLSPRIAGMYPAMREWLVRDGVPVAMPLSIGTRSLFGLSPDAFESAGLSREDYPQTWLDLYELLNRAPALLAECPDDIELFSGYGDVDSLKQRLFMFMAESYVINLKANGEPLRFDTPEFRAMLSAHEGTDWEALSAVVYPRGFSYDTNTPALFNLYCAVSLGDLNDYPFIPNPLRNSPGNAPVIAMNMAVAFVNPYSDEQELAMEYIEALAQNQLEEFWVELTPENNEPVISTTYELDLELYANDVQHYTRLVERNSDSERALELERKLENAIDKLEEHKRTGKYRVSPEDIAAYREAAQTMMFEPYFPLIGESPNSDFYYDIISQYSHGVLDGEAFIRTMDERLYMMELEGL